MRTAPAGRDNRASAPTCSTLLGRALARTGSFLLATRNMTAIPLRIVSQALATFPGRNKSGTLLALGHTFCEPVLASKLCKFMAFWVVKRPLRRP